MAYLPETLESVLQQTCLDFEVLIINDGSSDHIINWADQIPDPRIKLISQANQGVSVARNTAIKQAQGEYVAFLDADDLWEPTKLEKQLHCFENEAAVGLVYTWAALIDRLGKPTGRIFASHVEGNVWEKIVVDDMISNGSSPMVRRSCFETVGVFDPNASHCADRDMWTRIAAHYLFKVIKEPLTLYRIHSNNMSRKRQEAIQDLCQVIEKTFESAPLELLYLRNHSYGRLHLFHAWNYLDEGNYKEARHFRQQALLHHPQLRFSENYLRLSLAIAMIHWFGPQSYQGIRSLTQVLKKFLLNIFQISSSRLINMNSTKIIKQSSNTNKISSSTQIPE